MNKSRGEGREKKREGIQARKKKNSSFVVESEFKTLWVLEFFFTLSLLSGEWSERKRRLRRVLITSRFLLFSPNLQPRRLGKSQCSSQDTHTHSERDRQKVGKGKRKKYPIFIRSFPFAMNYCGSCKIHLSHLSFIFFFFSLSLSLLWFFLGYAFAGCLVEQFFFSGFFVHGQVVQCPEEMWVYRLQASSKPTSHSDTLTHSSFWQNYRVRR